MADQLDFLDLDELSDPEDIIKIRNDNLTDLYNILIKNNIDCELNILEDVSTIDIKANKKTFQLYATKYGNSLFFYNYPTKITFFIPIKADCKDFDEFLSLFDDLVKLVKLRPELIRKHLIKQNHLNLPSVKDRYRNMTLELTLLTYKYLFTPSAIEIIDAL